MKRIDKLEKLMNQLIQSQLKTDAQLAKTDAQLAKTDAQLAKTDAQLAKTDERLSNIGVNLGVVAEEFFYEALKESKTLGHITFDEVSSNVKNRIKKTEDEFDIVMYNGNSIAIIEIKHKVHPNDLVKLYTSKIENFKILNPVYKNFKIYLGIGGFSVPSAVEEDARKRGIAVLKQKANVAVIDADKLKVY